MWWIWLLSSRITYVVSCDTISEWFRAAKRKERNKQNGNNYNLWDEVDTSEDDDLTDASNKGMAGCKFLTDSWHSWTHSWHRCTRNVLSCSFVTQQRRKKSIANVLVPSDGKLWPFDRPAAIDNGKIDGDWVSSDDVSTHLGTKEKYSYETDWKVGV